MQARRLELSHPVRGDTWTERKNLTEREKRLPQYDDDAYF
jgi:hypothetical protein